MNTTRFLRPFARAAFRAPTAVRPAVMARPALASQQQKKTPEVGPQQMVHLHIVYGGIRVANTARPSSSRPCPS